MTTHQLDQLTLDGPDAPEVRTLDQIDADLRRIPGQLADLRESIDRARHRVLTAMSQWSDRTDLRAERERLIDRDLQRAEEAAVTSAERLVQILTDDVARLSRAAWTVNLTPTERQALAAALPVTVELASTMPAEAILGEIEGALLRRDRVALAAWHTVAGRIQSRRDLPFDQRGRIADAIRTARGTIADYGMGATIRTAEGAIADLREFARVVRDAANAHDEIAGGPLAVYKFGRRPIDAADAREYRRPVPTERWFRERAGLRLSTEG